MSQGIDSVERASLGLLLKTCRAAADIRQYRLATMAKVSVPTLCRIERGAAAPTPAVLQRLMVALPSFGTALRNLTAKNASTEQTRG